MSTTDDHQLGDRPNRWGRGLVAAYVFIGGAGLSILMVRVLTLVPAAVSGGPVVAELAAESRRFGLSALGFVSIAVLGVSIGIVRNVFRLRRQLRQHRLSAGLVPRRDGNPGEG